MQFLRENGLLFTLEVRIYLYSIYLSAFQVLQEESSVPLDFLDSVDKLTFAIKDGDWVAVFDAIRNLSLPDGFLVDLYEHVCLEFLERGEWEVSETLLSASAPLRKMQSSDPMSSARLNRLQALLDSRRVLKTDPYQGVTRQKRRIELIDKLISFIYCAPSKRLMSMLGDAIRCNNGFRQVDSDRMSFDPIRGVLRPDASRSCITSVKTLIQLPDGSKPECLAFHPDGQFLVTGSSDGMIEFYSEKDWKVSHELAFQQRGDFLVHDHSVTSLGFDQTGCTLASGDKSGKVCVWKFPSGDLVRTVHCSQRGAITAIRVDSDSNRLFVASDDGMVRVYGLKSGTKMKELAISNALVCKFSLFPNALLYSGGTDGVLKRMSCDSGTISQEVPFPGIGAHVINWIEVIETSSRSDGSVIVTYDGAPSVHFDGTSSVVMGEYATPEIHADGDSFMCSIASKKSGYVYCISKRGKLYCFDLNSAKCLNVFSFAEKEIKAAMHHPCRGILAVASSTGTIYVLGN
jgi:WD40 repeat-containing protein SMU1